MTKGLVKSADEAGDILNASKKAGVDIIDILRARGIQARYLGIAWNNYEKVTANDQEYAKVGDRLYSKHAVGTECNLAEIDLEICVEYLSSWR